MAPIHSTQSLGFLTISAFLAHLLLTTPTLSLFFTVLPLSSFFKIIYLLKSYIIHSLSPPTMHPAPYSPFSFHLTCWHFFTQLFYISLIAHSYLPTTSTITLFSLTHHALALLTPTHHSPSQVFVVVVVFHTALPSSSLTSSAYWR